MIIATEAKTKPSELSSYIDAGLPLFPLGKGIKGKADKRPLEAAIMMLAT